MRFIQCTQFRDKMIIRLKMFIHIAKSLLFKALEFKYKGSIIS